MLVEVDMSLDKRCGGGCRFGSWWAVVWSGSDEDWVEKGKRPTKNTVPVFVKADAALKD